MDAYWFRWALGVSEMSWTDDQYIHLYEMGNALSEQETVRQKNLKHWFKGYTMGLAILTSLFSYDEVVKRWEELNAQ
jgi:hypothetical protein